MSSNGRRSCNKQDVEQIIEWKQKSTVQKRPKVSWRNLAKKWNLAPQTGCSTNSTKSKVKNGTLRGRLEERKELIFWGSNQWRARKLLENTLTLAALNSVIETKQSKMLHIDDTWLTISIKKAIKTESDRTNPSMFSKTSTLSQCVMFRQLGA